MKPSIPSQMLLPETLLTSESLVTEALELEPLIRNQLRSQLARKSELKTSSLLSDLSLTNLVSKVVGQILDVNPPNSTTDSLLKELFFRFSAIYHNHGIPKALKSRRFICNTGLVLSPDHCIHTLKDTRRVSAFIRSVHQCIQNQLAHGKTDIRLAYPACGPFAPLLVTTQMV